MLVKVGLPWRSERHGSGVLESPSDDGTLPQRALEMRLWLRSWLGTYWICRPRGRRRKKTD